MRKKDITIIIPMYNMGYIIEDTLNSLLQQTNNKFKVLIVDDGSIDNGASIVKQWMKNNTLDIEYIFQSNQGVSAARNNAINKSDTPYIFFLDADDILPYNTIELMYKYIENYDIVGGLVSRNISQVYAIDNQYTMNEGVDFVHNKFLYDNSSLSFACFVYKKSILDQFCIRFSKNLKYGEDEEFTWKYLCHCKSALFINLPVYLYRSNPVSSSHTITISRTQVIDSMVSVSNYYRACNHSFYTQLNRYGIPRAKLAILKQFAQSKRKDLYDDLINSEDYKAYSISNLTNFPSKKISMASLLFCISPTLFYYLLTKI